jgi:precorrin-6A synthase
MRTLLAIGIGAGDPEFVTIQAVNALNTVDVFFVFDKQGPGIDLSQARRAVCERYIRDPHYRVVELANPSRDRAATEYAGAVRDWRDKRAELLEQAIEAELPDGGRGGILVWGDPTLYDSTIRVFDTLVERGRLQLDYQVIPGISSISALAARHRIPLNQVAAPVHVTTGRRLAQGLPDNTDDVLVMLDRADADLSCTYLREGDWHIYWGAYLGTEQEALRSGPLAGVIDEINHARRELREQHGWLMDTYLLRR